MIELIKIAKYELKPTKGDNYKYIKNVLIQKINPDTLCPGMIAIQSDVLIISTLKRSINCVKYIGKSKCIIDKRLREVPFDFELSGFNKTDWINDGSKVVRQAFKKLFIDDMLEIKRKEIFDEIRGVLDVCKSYQKNSRSVTIVSHSFRLKLIIAYLETRGEIEQKPELINQYIFDDKKTLDFCDTIRIDVGF